MKNLYTLLSFATCMAAHSITIHTFDSLKMSLSLQKSKQVWGSDLVNKNTSEFITILQNLTEAQKKRKLTLEELNLAYYALIYLFSTQYQNYTSKVVVSLDNQTLNLPFSSELLINLITAIMEEENNTSA